MKRNGENINIMDEISDYRQLYNCLLAPKNYIELNDIIYKCRTKSVYCVIYELFWEWLNGSGVNPVTWHTLIRKLHCAAMTELADVIELEMEDNNLSRIASLLEEVQNCSLLNNNKDHIQGKNISFTLVVIIVIFNFMAEVN